MFHTGSMLRGQALVVVVLILAVALTVALSIASRSVTELNVSTVEDESARALDAAEAGVEAALGNVAQSAGPTPVGGMGSTYQFTSSDIGNGGSVSPAEQVKAGEAVTIFMSNHDASGNLVLNDPAAYNKQINFCWGDSSVIDNKSTPALEVKLYYYAKATATFGVAARGFDPVSGRAGRNGMAVSGSSGSQPCTKDGRTYGFWEKNLSLTNLGMPAGGVPLYLRLRLYYNGDTGHYVGVEETAGTGTNNFPYQGKSVISAGRAGVTQRKVSVFQRYYDLPPVLDGALYSGVNLSKP